MTQINTLLKRIFTVFNIFFAIVGGVVILLSLLSQVFTSTHGAKGMEGRISGLIVLYTLGSVILIISVLGAYGAHKESKVAMIIFLVCMVIGSLLMLRIGVTVAISRPEVEPLLEQKFRTVLPLDTASHQVKEMAESLQMELQCCGLFSYKDWEDSIPDSCLCKREEDECQTIGYGSLMQFPQPRMSIYSKTCFPILMHYILMIMDVMIGVVFTLACLALLGMILSSIIISQMRRNRTPAILLTVPAIFNGGASPPKYQELQNPPGY